MSKLDPNRIIVMKSVLVAWFSAIAITMIFLLFFPNIVSHRSIIGSFVDILIGSYLIVNSAKSFWRQIIVSSHALAVNGLPNRASISNIWLFRERTPYLLETQGHVPPTQRRRYAHVLREYMIMSALSLGMYILSGWFIFLGLVFLFFSSATQQLLIWGAMPACVMLGAHSKSSEALSSKLGHLLLITQFVSMITPVHSGAAVNKSHSLVYSLRNTPNHDWTEAASFLIESVPLVLVDCRADSPAFLEELSLVSEKRAANDVLAVANMYGDWPTDKTRSVAIAQRLGVKIVSEPELIDMFLDGRVGQILRNRSRPKLD